MTSVDFTTATASTPGTSPSSRTASLLISETTRCGPHWISTCAITRSHTTSVTNPTKRLRADRSTNDGSGVAWACALANKGKAHKPEHMGIAGRRVLVSRKWSNKELVDLGRTDDTAAESEQEDGDDGAAGTLVPVA